MVYPLQDPFDYEGSIHHLEICPFIHPRLSHVTNGIEQYHKAMPMTYTDQDLTNTLLDAISSETALTTKRRLVWERIIAALPGEKRLHTTMIPLEWYMEKLDDFYFFGLLHPYTSIRWRDYSHTNMYRLGEAEQDHSRGFPHHVITLYWKAILRADDTAHQSGTTDAVIIGLILHECLHVYFMIYACRKRSCRLQRLCGSGILGHGPEWKRAANAMESDIRAWHSRLRGATLVLRDRDGYSIQEAEERGMTWSEEEALAAYGYKAFQWPNSSPLL